MGQRKGVNFQFGQLLLIVKDGSENFQTLYLLVRKQKSVNDLLSGGNELQEN